MNFRKYMHIERLNTPDVDGILDGMCYVFPKLDGTNASLWLDDEGNLCAGSRNMKLSTERDNAGFFAAMCYAVPYIDYLVSHPNHRLFGEWMVPHTLRSYTDDTWSTFFVFDVAIDDGDGLRYLPYDDYWRDLDAYNIPYIPPILIAENPTMDDLAFCLDTNTFRVREGCGKGEGIVIKNYAFKSPRGDTLFAKIVSDEFKEQNKSNRMFPHKDDTIEAKIAWQYVTHSLVEKEQAKIATELGNWCPQYIPRLLGQVFHCVVSEESWNIVKKFKMPTINFHALSKECNKQVKLVAPELF